MGGAGLSWREEQSGAQAPRLMSSLGPGDQPLKVGRLHPGVPTSQIQPLDPPPPGTPFSPPTLPGWGPHHHSPGLGTAGCTWELGRVGWTWWPEAAGNRTVSLGLPSPLPSPTAPQLRTGGFCPSQRENKAPGVCMAALPHQQQGPQLECDLHVPFAQPCERSEVLGCSRERLALKTVLRPCSGLKPDSSSMANSVISRVDPQTSHPQASFLPPNRVTWLLHSGPGGAPWPRD